MNNYPDGVTESMIPGNRPEDQEVELSIRINITLTQGEVDDLANAMVTPLNLTEIFRGNDDMATCTETEIVEKILLECQKKTRFKDD